MSVDPRIHCTIHSTSNAASSIKTAEPFRIADKLWIMSRIEEIQRDWREFGRIRLVTASV
jgi:hypothetical protein